jgi:hypothetical protein
MKAVSRRWQLRLVVVAVTLTVALTLCRKYIMYDFKQFNSNFQYYSDKKKQVVSTDQERNSSNVTQQHAHFPSNMLEVDHLFVSLRGCEADSVDNRTNTTTKRPIRQDHLQQTFKRAKTYIKESSLLGTPHFFPMPHFDFNATIAGKISGGVALFANAYIQGDRPTVFNCHMLYVPGGCKSQWGSQFKMWRSATDASQQHHPDVTAVETAVLLHQYWGDVGYYHATVELLPRLAYVLDYLRSNPATVILASNKFIYRRRHAFNRLLGLSSNQTWMPYGFQNGKTYIVKRLLVPTGTPCGEAQPKAVVELRKAMASTGILPARSPDPTQRKGGNMMVLLQKRTSRRILNHEELLRALQAEFPIVREFQGTESVEDTIALHNAADVIIGPHGSGLANLVFSHRNAGAVELHQTYGNYGGDGVNFCHQATAKAAGLRSRILVQNDGSKSTDFNVNVTEAVETVRELLQWQERPN